MSKNFLGFMGDIHGNLHAAQFMLWTFHRYGVKDVIQVGDFGIYSDRSGERFANAVNEYAGTLGMNILVVPGNHENWRIINELVGDNRTDPAPYRSNISIAPRGYRWERDGVSFVALGGAPSVDRAIRKEWDRGSVRANMSWYAEEAITPEDVEYTVSLGAADVMVAHDAPFGVKQISDAIRGNPHGFRPSDLMYADEGRALLSEAVRGVSPRLFFHGHYHTPVYENIRRPGGEYDEQTLVVGLDCEFNNYSMALLDTVTLTVQRVDHLLLIPKFLSTGLAL